MEYMKPTMEVSWLAKKNVICTSTLVTDPLKPYPGEGEDVEEWD